MPPKPQAQSEKRVPPHRVTTAEIARKLGLARSTVTMALNDSPKINAETRLRVQDAARKMNYVPNSIARAMKRGKSGTLGLVINVQPGEHIFRMVIGAMEGAMRGGYTVKIIRSEWKMDADALAELCITHCLEGVMVGNVWPGRIADFHQRLREVGIPLATLLAPGCTSDAFSVWSDDAVGQHEAVSHLHRLGHTRIGFIGGNVQVASEKLRLQGFRSALEQHDLPIDPSTVVECDFDPVKIERATRIILAPRSQRPTALLCANDQTAMVVTRTARKMRIEVPHHLSVIGFSNLSMAEFSDPPLTSVDQDFERVGDEAAKAIVNLINEGKTDFSETSTRECRIPTSLVIRESTSIPPAD